mmetsp:Transcript_12390/g.40491  ORF Transcript_12390/g.40491 Transcript_12390/m.40491 type:complete len:379 (-) Transcript_12390:208-1344(-)
MCRPAPREMGSPRGATRSESSDDVDYETEEEEEAALPRKRPSTRFFSLAGLQQPPTRHPRKQRSKLDDDDDEGGECVDSDDDDDVEIDEDYFGKPVESALTQQLKALFLSIKMAGLATCRASSLHEISLSQEGSPEEVRDKVKAEAASLLRGKKRGVDIGWANEVALARYAATDGLRSSSSTSVTAEEFVVMADLAASLRMNGVKIAMPEVQELWDLLVADCEAGDSPLKLSFAQFEAWLEKFHPQLQGAKRIILASFTTTDAFAREFKFHTALVDRLLQARHHRKVSAQTKDSSFRLLGACLCSFGPGCKAAFDHHGPATAGAYGCVGPTQFIYDFLFSSTTKNNDSSSSRGGPDYYYYYHHRRPVVEYNADLDTTV